MSEGTNAIKTIEKLKSTFAVMGLPKLLVSDNGPPFNSAELQKFYQVNGIIALKTPPYHPQSNGVAESHVRNVKANLTKQLLQNSHSELKVEQQIVNFLFSYRNTPNAVSGLCPNDYVFKFKPRTRLDLLKPASQDAIIMKKPEKTVCPPTFVVGEKVLVGKLGPEQGVNWKEGVIMKVISALTYLVNVEGRIVYKHVNSLRKSVLKDNISAALFVSLPEVVVKYPSQSTSEAEAEGYVIEASDNVNTTPVKQNVSIQETCVSTNQNQEQPLRRSGRKIKPPQRLNF